MKLKDLGIEPNHIVHCKRISNGTRVAMLWRTEPPFGKPLPSVGDEIITPAGFMLVESIESPPELEIVNQGGEMVVVEKKE